MPYTIFMETIQNAVLAALVTDFSLPPFSQLPNMGLYLEQVTKYINQCLEPLGCFEMTGSMIRNYVKMGLIKNPLKKQYYSHQIARLLAITVLKPVMSLENIRTIFRLQQLTYSDAVAYDYFCTELRNNLRYRFGLSDNVPAVGVTVSAEKEMIRSAVTAVAHIVYLEDCFRYLAENQKI